MSQYLAENLIYLRHHAGLTQDKMAAALEVNRSSLSAYEVGKTEPAIAVLLKYARYFQLSVDDLLTHSLRENPQLLQPQPTPLKILAITVGEDNEENIELINEKAAAGYTYAYGDPEYVRNLPKFRLPFLKGGTFRAFEIRGDSMLPIVSGSVIVGEYIEKLDDIKANSTYIFNTRNNGVLFKRVAGMDKEKVVLQSDNRAYASYSLPLSEVQEIWKTRLVMSHHFS